MNPSEILSIEQATIKFVKNRRFSWTGRIRCVLPREARHARIKGIEDV